MIYVSFMKNYILLIAAMFLSNVCLPDTAPEAWVHKSIPQTISSKALYLPISHPSVRAVHIKESQEELVDLFESNNPRLIPLSLFDEKYKNTYPGWSKVRAGVYQKLLKMLDFLPNNIGIAYFEGFRTLSKQKEYFDKKFLEISQEVADKDLAYQETTKHVSPFIDNIPTHATGAAIDMTLFSVHGDQTYLLDMGQFDTIFGPNAQQETFSTHTTDLQKDNRLLLLKAATQAGLANYGFEWWHYSYGDKMYAFVYNKPCAIYGLADTEDPILCMTKDEYIAQMTQ